MKYCKYCDKEFEDKDKFCDTCGKKLIKIKQKEGTEKTEKSYKSKKLFIILGIMIILLIIIGFYVTGTIQIPSKGDITTKSEAQQKITDFSSEIKDVKVILDDILKTLE